METNYSFLECIPLAKLVWKDETTRLDMLCDVLDMLCDVLRNHILWEYRFYGSTGISWEVHTIAELDEFSICCNWSARPHHRWRVLSDTAATLNNFDVGAIEGMHNCSLDFVIREEVQ